MSSARDPQAALVALTAEAKAALGGALMPISCLPFRVGRETRGRGRAAPRTLADRRKPGSRPTNELYLPETAEPFEVSRDHFQIQHNGARYVLIDRQSRAGTIVEGTVVGGQRQGGAVELDDGDVIIVGTSKSPYVFKFRAGSGA